MLKKNVRKHIKMFSDVRLIAVFVCFMMALAFGALFDAFIVRLTIVPAVIVLLGVSDAALYISGINLCLDDSIMPTKAAIQVSLIFRFEKS